MKEGQGGRQRGQRDADRGREAWTRAGAERHGAWAWAWAGADNDSTIVRTDEP